MQSNGSGVRGNFNKSAVGKNQGKVSPKVPTGNKREKVGQ